MSSGISGFDRTWSRPTARTVPGLSALEIEPLESSEALARRLREVFGSALVCADTLDFDAEELDPSGIPEWFTRATSLNSINGPDSVSVLESVRLYVSARGEQAWGIQDWLSCLDPRLRRWEWWDVTRAEEGRLTLWVDSHGERHFPREELYWAAFAAGARGVNAVVHDPQEWLNAPSAGLDERTRP